MGVRCRDCGRESRLEPQCLERPSTPLIQLLFSCKSYQHFLLTPTITPHSWALFSLFTAHQGEGSERERRQREEAEEGKEKWNILAPDFNWQNGSALSFSFPPSSLTQNSFPRGLFICELIMALCFNFLFLTGYCLCQCSCNIARHQTAKRSAGIFLSRTRCIFAAFMPAHKHFSGSFFFLDKLFHSVEGEHIS